MIVYSKKIEEIEEKIKKLEKIITLANITKNKNLILIGLENLTSILKDILEINPLIKGKEKINSIINISEHRKKSGMEFLRNNEIVILSDNQKIKKISLIKLMEFLSFTKNLIYNMKQF